MTEFEKHFSKIKDFLVKYGNLIECHLVDFLTENLWKTSLPENLRLHIEKIGCKVTSEINESTICDNSVLQEFLRNCKSLHLESSNNILTRENFLDIINYKKSEIDKPNESEFMKVKKWHEVDVFTKTIVWLSKDRPSLIIDAGAGKGYSSLHLSNHYGLPVLAIECSQINHKGAIQHRDLVHKKNRESMPLIHYAVEKIDQTTNYIKMVENHFPGLEKEKELVMTALHACGSLTDSVIMSFLNVIDIKSLCIVPCCYHLATKSLTSVYEFSKNSRMLAQQSTDRTRQKNLSLSPSLFYRAVLQVIFKHLGIENAKIGRGAPLDDFPTYAKWALKKLDIAETVSDEVLEKTYEEYQSSKWKFDVFQLLRIQIAPVIEAAIILDKILYMQKSNICKTLQLVQLFDPIMSPRSWAIIATK